MVAVEERQGDVHQHQMRVEGDELLDNVAEILHHARLAAPALDVALDGGGDDAVVLDDEYAVVHRPILRISR